MSEANRQSECVHTDDEIDFDQINADLIDANIAWDAVFQCLIRFVDTKIHFPLQPGEYFEWEFFRRMLKKRVSEAAAHYDRLEGHLNRIQDLLSHEVNGDVAHVTPFGKVVKYLRECRVLNESFSNGSPKFPSKLEDVVSLGNTLSCVVESARFRNGGESLREEAHADLRYARLAYMNGRLFSRTSATKKTTATNGEFHSTETNVETDVKTESQENGVVPVLSDLQYSILEAMYELKATSADNLRSCEEIAVRCGGKMVNVSSYKNPCADLKKRELTQSKPGSRGGAWLTTKGVNVVESLVINRKKFASKQ